MPQPKESRLALAGAFGLSSVIVLTLSAALSYVSTNRWVDHTLQVRQAAEDWTIALLDAESATHEYVVTEEPLLLQAYDRAISRERAEGAAVRDLVVDN